MLICLQATHKFICEHHRNVAQSIRLKRRRKDSEDEYESGFSEVRGDDQSQIIEP